MKKRPVIFYGWYIVATGLMLQALGYGARYSFAVIFPSLLEEFKWPRDVTAAMFSVHLLAYGCFAPMAGSMVDRTGPRKTMIFGTIIFTLGLALSRWGSEPWHFYCTYGILSGIGLCFMGSVPMTTVLKNWFEAKRGLAFSLVGIGSGVSYALYYVIAFLIDRFGWRTTFVVEAIAVAAVMLPLILFVVRYHPREKGLVPDGIVPLRGNSSGQAMASLRIVDQSWAATDWTLPLAMRTSRFWLLCLTTFSVWGIAQHIVVAHHVAFAIDAGYSTLYASSVLSIYGLLYALGALSSFISDRIGREATLTTGGVISISGILVLMLIKDTSSPWMLYYYAVASGFGQGMISPTINASITDIFQGPKVGSVFGFIWFSFAVGGTIGPWLGGWIFEFTGGYTAAFILSTVVLAVACAAIWLAAPRKVRLVPGQVRTQ